MSRDKQKPQELLQISGDPSTPSSLSASRPAHPWWLKLIVYSFAILFWGGVVFMAVRYVRKDVQQWRQNAASEKRENDAQTKFLSGLTARYGPDAVERHAMAGTDACLSFMDDKKLESWSVVDEEGRVICKNPRPETTIRILHCETVQQKVQPK